LPLRDWASWFRADPQGRGIFRRIFDYVIRLHGSPEDVAWGLALGIFVAMTPTVGAQMLIAIPLASLLRVNSAAAALGVWLTNPLTIPFFYSLTYFVGARICGYEVSLRLGEGIALTSWTSLWEAGSNVLLSLAVGGLVVGAVLALASYHPTLYMVRAGRATLQRRRERRKNRRRRKGKRR
jgi:uncharacterized protein (DUF2062 family)